MNKLSAYFAAFVLAAVCAVLYFAPITAEAKGFSGGRSSFSSSSFSSRSSFSSSRSYSSPSRSSWNSSAGRSSFSRSTISTPKPSVIRSTPRTAPTYRRPVVVNRTTVVHKSYPRYSYYSPSPRPSHFSSNAGWYAFGALVAYNLLSDNERLNVPTPDFSALAGVPLAELSKSIWADGSMSLAEVKAYNAWKQLNPQAVK